MLLDNDAQTYLNGTNNWDCYETFNIGGTTFSTRGTPPVKRGILRNALGDEVATCTFTILCGEGNTTPIAAALAGDWDGVALTVTRVFNGLSMVRFEGFVADVRPSSTSVEVTGKSLLIDLVKKIPPRTFGSQCSYIFGETACGATGSPCTHTIDTCSGNWGGFNMIPPET